MDNRWLVEMFLEAGLEDEDSRKAADACIVRLLTRERPKRRDREKRALTDYLVRDPLVSLNRIIGRGEEGLPFVDAETRRLSSAMLGHTAAEAGLDPAVAIAYAKVVVEVYEPEHLYQPIWEGLGHSGPVDLEVLRHEDWSALKIHFADLIPSDQEQTVRVRVKPKARPPQP